MADGQMNRRRFFACLPLSMAAPASATSRQERSSAFVELQVMPGDLRPVNVNWAPGYQKLALQLRQSAFDLRKGMKL